MSTVTGEGGSHRRMSFFAFMRHYFTGTKSNRRYWTWYLMWNGGVIFTAFKLDVGWLIAVGGAAWWAVSRIPATLDRWDRELETNPIYKQEKTDR